MLSCSVVSNTVAAPWTVACQAPSVLQILQARIPMSGLPFPSPGDLHPAIEAWSRALAGGFFTTEPPRKPT